MRVHHETHDLNGDGQQAYLSQIEKRAGQDGGDPT
jgi:hypothetical protein